MISSHQSYSKIALGSGTSSFILRIQVFNPPPLPHNDKCNKLLTSSTWDREFDPWRSGGVSSPRRPGGPVASTANMPVILVPGAHHNADLATAAGLANAGVKAAQDNATAQMKQWVGEFYTEKGKTAPF